MKAQETSPMSAEDKTTLTKLAESMRDKKLFVNKAKNAKNLLQRMSMASALHPA
jgi:hypothetical protein